MAKFAVNQPIAPLFRRYRMFLEKINSPLDVKKLATSDLTALSNEVRAAVINRISKFGGHKGPNLGVVELTVAYHYVFDSPKDKIVFDVSHQCYPHKILTGRKNAFLNDDCFADVTGYTNPAESEHDFFLVGHTSTSVSLALGLCKGRDLNGTDENIVALIGDGSLSGGEALEAIDYAGEYDKNLIIIVNDNDQCIAENHGGIYKNLKALRDSNGLCEQNIFKSFGLDYRYLDDGHDVCKLVELFRSVKGIDHPVVLHIHTIKGKGLWYAEKDREAWHAGGPFNVEDGTPINKSEPDTTVHDSLIDLLKRDDKAIILNAATPVSLGFYGEERAELIRLGRYVDVGIAEENAMAMASGVAKNGGTAVFGTYAPFLQRTYDQLSHDLCLNDNPATILVFSPGVYGFTSNTHLGTCDIQLFTSVPNLIYLDPSCTEEYLAMLDYATTQKSHPVAIRVPNRLYCRGYADQTDYSVLKYSFVNKGSEVAIIATGPVLKFAMLACEELKVSGKNITVISPRFLSGVDEELLEGLLKDHKYVITAEDGQVDGGFGQRISAFYGTYDMKVINLGVSKKFHSDFNPDELLKESGISKDGLKDLVLKLCK